MARSQARAEARKHRRSVLSTSTSEAAAVAAADRSRSRSRARSKSRSHSQSRSRSRSRSRSASSTRKTLTTPRAPRFQTDSRLRGKDGVASSLEQELEEIEKARRLHKQRIQINRENANIVCEFMGEVLPARSTRKLTEPVEFKLHTTARLGDKAVPASSLDDSGSNESELNMSMASTASRGAGKANGMTVAKPFSFATDARLHKDEHDKSEGEYVPLSELSRQFQKSMRGESTSRPSSRKSSPTANHTTRKTNYHHNKLTTFKEFKLSTDSRAASSRDSQRPLSTAEREELEIKSFKPFKARPINPKILNSCGDVGVPRVAKAKSTTFKEFKLSSSNKVDNDEEMDLQQQQQQPKPFKARPFPNRVFQSDNRIKTAAKVAGRQKLTEPVSPKLSKSNRTHRAPSPPKESFKSFKARPIPTSVFKLTPKKRTSTKFKPFNLHTEVRGAKHEEDLDQKLAREEEEEKEAREFVARPIDMSGPALPRVERMELVTPEPFQLQSVRLAERHKEELQAKIAREEAEAKRRFSSFKARKNPLKDKQPFLVLKSDKPLTEIDAFALASDEQAERRMSFEAEKEERRREAEKQQARAKALREKKEKRAISELRRTSLVHKARPIMTRAGHVPAKQDIALTTPLSPEFITKKRAQMRGNEQQQE